MSALCIRSLFGKPQFGIIPVLVDGFLAVGEAIDEIHKQLDEQKKINATADKRLTKLEQQVARYRKEQPNDRCK
jgi:hypothetical protein